METLNEAAMKEYDGEQWFRLAQASDKTDVLPATLKYWIRTKAIRGRKFGMAAGSPWYIPSSEIVRIQERVGS